MNNKDFYDTLDLRYPEIAECLVTNDNKFYIPVLMALVDYAGLPPKSISVNNNPAKLFNKENNIGLSSITRTNYIELEVPQYLWYEDYRITGIKYNAGDKFIIIFVGGDLNKIRIIGRY